MLKKTNLAHTYLKRMGIFISVCLFFLTFTSSSVLAAGPLAIYTEYPGISAQPGSSITFPLTISGTGAVDIKVIKSPSDWNCMLYGNGMKIHRVYVPSNDFANADLRVQIPSEAENGSYDIVLEASNNAGRATLALNVKIDTSATGEDEIKVQYPALSGPDTATFSFRGTLYNNSGRTRFYTLGSKSPDGWQVSFKPAYQNNQITSLSLEPGKSQDLDITVKPPKGVKAGKYTITAAAVYGSEAASVDLEVEILGNYSMDITTKTGRLNADLTAGKKGSVTLELVNTGSADLQGIRLSSSTPSGWAVTFEPETIERLESGETQQVTAFITPSNKAIAGDYIVNISASTSETSDDADIRVTVHTSTLWGLIGVIIIAGVVAWVYWTFKTYGRR